MTNNAKICCQGLGFLTQGSGLGSYDKQRLNWMKLTLLFSSCLYETMTWSYMEGGWLLRKRSCGRRTQTTQKCKHINRAKNKVTSQHQKVIDISLIKGSHFGVHRPFTYRTLLFRDLPSCLMILWCFLRKRSKCLHLMWVNHDGSVLL